MIRFFNKQFDYPQIIVILLFFYIGIVYFSIAIANISLGLAVFVFVIAIFLKGIKLNFKAYNVYKYLFVIVPFLLTVTSVVHSDNSLMGLNYIWLRMPILVVPFILIFSEVKTKILIKGLKIFVILTITASLITIYNAARFINEDILFSPEFTFFITVIQHPYLGVFVLITFITIIEFEIIKYKILKIIIFSILITTLLLTTSRLVYLIFLILIGIYLFKYVSKIKTFILISLLTVLMASIVLINKSLIKKFQTSFEYENSPRLKLWDNAYKIISFSNNSMLGIGIGDYYEDKKDAFFFKENEEGIYGYNPHSQIIEFYVTNGLLGVTILLISIYFGFKNLKKQTKFSSLVFGMILLFSFTESILTRQYGVQLYCLFIPLIFKDNFKK